MIATEEAFKLYRTYTFWTHQFENSPKWILADHFLPILRDVPSIRGGKKRKKASARCFVPSDRNRKTFLKFNLHNRTKDAFFTA